MESFVFKDKDLEGEMVEYGENKDLSEKFNKGKAKSETLKGPVILTQLFQVTLPPDLLVATGVVWIWFAVVSTGQLLSLQLNSNSFIINPKDPNKTLVVASSIH